MILAQYHGSETSCDIINNPSLISLPPLLSWHTILKTLESLNSPTCCAFLYAKGILMDGMHFPRVPE